MKSIIGAIALLMAAPAAAQTTPAADPHAGHAQHQQQGHAGHAGHAQHQQQGHAGHAGHAQHQQQGHAEHADHAEHKAGCCKDAATHKECCEKAMQQGKAMECCKKHQGQPAKDR